MLTYNELKEKCNCWTGYKRKPGTKPCAEDSCMKEELGGKEKTTGLVSLKSHKVMAFGRMNPITSGHESVVNKVHEIAKKHNADHVVIVSHSQDAKKNPLTGEQKVQHAKNAFPGTNVQSASKEHPTILHHAAQAHSSGAQHLHVVAGSDRHEEMHNLLHKYNGQKAAHGHYNFKSITVHSSGARDPDAEGTTGISASKMREHAASGNKAEFHKGAPSKMKPEHKDAMYNDVRKGMNIKEETIQEKLRPEMGAGVYVNDFIASTNPRFNNKSKEERRRMAIGAYMAAKARGVKEEVQIDELSTDLLAKYKTAAHANAKASDAAGNYAKGDKRFKGINKATNKQFDNDLKKHGQMKEENSHYEDSQKHLNLASKALETSDMVSHHGHMADHHDSLSQWHDSKGRSSAAQRHADKAEEHAEKYTKLARDAEPEPKKQGVAEASATMQRYGQKILKRAKAARDAEPEPKKEEPQAPSDISSISTRDLMQQLRKPKKQGVTEGTLQGNIGGGDAMNTTTSAPSASTAKDTTMGKKIKGFKFFNGENDKQMNMNQPVKEEKKEEPPFDGPYKSNFKKPNNPSRTGMDSARSLAQRAMDQVSKKKPVKEAKDEQEYGYEGDMALNQLKTLVRCAEMIEDMLKPDTDLPEWVQSKITLATDYIQTAADYLYSEMNENHIPVAPVLDRKYIKGTPENKALRAKNKPINGHPTNVKEEAEQVEESVFTDDEGIAKKLVAKHGKNVRPSDVKLAIHLHPEGHKTTADRIHAHVKRMLSVKEETLDEKSDQAKQNKTMKNMMDASRGARYKLNNPVPETDHKTAQAKNVAIGRALRSEATAQKGVNVDKVNAAGQEPHEENFETAPKTVSKLKKVKEENMKSYKEFLQGLEEKLIGKQHKIDKNKNGKVDANDFELLRKEEADHLLEYTPGPDGKTIIKGRSYGADYVDPEGADETAADMKKKEKKPAGRKTGQSTGSYKPRATMSKLKSAGSTYK